MKQYRRFNQSIWYLAFSLFLFLVTYLAGEISPYRYTEKSVAQDFETVLHHKEIILNDLLADLEGRADWEEFSQIADQAEQQGLNVLVYRHDTLAYWSVNSIDVPFTYHDSLFEESLQFFNNSWHECRTVHKGRMTLVGLILIKYEYQYENKYLRNRFHEDFNLPEHTRLLEGTAGPIKIHNVSGGLIGSLDISNAPSYSPSQVYFSLICYYAAIILLSVFLRKVLRLFKPGKWRNYGILMFGLSLLLLYLTAGKLLVPKQLTTLALFSPETYAVSSWFSSLADLLTWSYLMFLAIYTFYADFHIIIDRDDEGRPARPLINAVGKWGYFLMVLVFFLYVSVIIGGLIMHSNISFLTFRVLEIDLHTFVGLLIVAFHFAAFGLLADKFISTFRPPATIKNLVLYPALFAAGSFLAGVVFHVPVEAPVAVVVAVILVIMGLKRYRKDSSYKYSTFVLLLFFFGIIAVYKIIVLSDEKQKTQMRVIAVDLAAENDPVAELLLKELEPQIRGDSLLSFMLTGPYLDEIEIFDYVTETYFQGFWDKYDLQYTICSPVDTVYVQPPVDELFHCHSFFDKLVDSFGIRLPSSGFYFFDNLNGRISYFSAFTFWSDDSTYQSTLYIELDSKLVSQEFGYPELLVSGRYQENNLDDNLSYAKYHDSELITRSGPFLYSLVSDGYTSGVKEFEQIQKDNYLHLVYNPDEFNTIIVSRRKIRILDILITFTYLFVFFYICVTINLLIVYVPFIRNSFVLNIKNKIQYSLILILVLSLLLIGGGSIYYSVRQFKIRQNTSLRERIQSVYVELMHKLQYEEDLSQGWQSEGYQNLDELLRKFSNVFYTDIHLYDPGGELMATSRREIFEKGLQGRRIHHEAFIQLAVERRNEYVNQERIGSLTFLSAYVPFMNSENRLLAYLNLPYFTRQDSLTTEISNLVVGIVNFYMLLITLSVLVAVFISLRITQPLQMIQSKLGKFTLGRTDEKIDYESDDEIGSLVREYNSMVDQLARSVELLARSERESAWREMAKQIAHEIKNPLTPMKLSVQHLQRSWKDNPENWEQNLERISQTLVEQIDNLSSIATEFSNFAKMPKPNNVRLNLGNKLSKTVELFAKTADVRFITQYHNKQPAMVYADKEQLSSVFINLIKNAIQSIPDDRDGVIRIGLDTAGGEAKVRISDNGKGIPEDLGDKLFQPNFTTKSSGMGMGLAIVKNIVDNAGGRVSYETVEGEGTTFIVTLPLI